MKKIAFIKDGVVGVALNTDDSLQSYFLTPDHVIEVTFKPDVEAGWTYDAGVFTAPIVEYVEPNDPNHPIPGTPGTTE
jgi:hypothetical protein